MTQFNATKLTAGRQTVTGGLALKKQTLTSQVWVDVTASTSDTYYFGKLPKGAVITGGRVFSGRLASGTCVGSCCVAFALGVDQIVANASGTTYGVASLTSGLGFFGPIDYSTMVSGLQGTTARFDSGFTCPLGGLLLTQGGLTVTVDPTNVFATLSVAAGSGSGISGYLNLELDYYTGTYS